MNTTAEFYGGLFRVIAGDNSTLKSLTSDNQFVVNLEVVLALEGLKFLSFNIIR